MRAQCVAVPNCLDTGAFGHDRNRKRSSRGSCIREKGESDPRVY